MKMFDKDDILFAASATTVVLLSAVNVTLHLRRRCHRFWACTSLLTRKRYSAADFTRDLILNDEDLLSSEYKSGLGFHNFFRK